MKWRLAIAFLGITFLVLLVQDFPLSSYLRTVEEDRIVTTLERDSFVLAARSQEAFDTDKDNHATLHDIVTNYKASTGGSRILVTDAKAIVLADTHLPSIVGKSIMAQPGVPAALQGNVAQGRTATGDASARVLFVAVPILHGSQTLGVVLSSYPLATITAVVNQRISMLLVVAGLSLAIAALIAIIVARSITRGIEELEDVTVAFATGDLNARASSDQPDPETKALAKSFNTMASQISQLMEQQRSFAGDASHQLRTPLTALQLRLESAAELVDVDPSKASGPIDAAINEAERLQRIIEGLLVLSRSDGQQGVGESHPVDLAAIARDRAESWSALAADSDVTLVVDAPVRAKVMALPNVVEQVIDNYVDNALEVSPAGSTITIEILPQSDTTQLRVMDQGPGMPEEDLERAFNRFWRARSDSSGSGLGLAIVQRLVTLGGGTVALTNRPSGGLEATATFRSA